MGAHGQTPSQTVGPYFAMILAASDDDQHMAAADTPGEPIRVVGRVLDGAGDPVEDALLEVWQADADGRYHHPLDDASAVRPDGGFCGFGRSRTRFEDGTWQVTTIRPGAVAGPEGRRQAPHLNLCVQSRGMLNPLFTRVYFDDEAEANTDDPVLAVVPADRRHTLVAATDPASTGEVHTFRFDVVLQGEDETVFLDF